MYYIEIKTMSYICLLLLLLDGQQPKNFEADSFWKGWKKKYVSVTKV